MKIILADDHALFRGGMALLFQQVEDGTLVLEAGDLEEAMALASRHPDTDLILLDLGMPGMKNNVEGIKRLSAAYPQLPVIVLSACETKEVIQTVITAGALGFIPKSSSAAVMQSAIHLVLSGGVYLPAQLLLSDEVRSGHNGHGNLTERQRDVLRLLAAGMSNKQICHQLGLGEGTIKSHIAAIFRYLDVSNRTEASNAAQKLGLID